MSTSWFFNDSVMGQNPMYTPPPIPSTDDKATVDAMAKAQETERQKIGKGRASTILTSNLGLDEDSTSSRKVLWGS